MYALIRTIQPFDAAKGCQIDFSWSGNQFFKVNCIIKENKSGKEIYRASQDNMKPFYTIPAGTGLRNGTRYEAYITVITRLGDKETESSLQTIGTPFYCFSTPGFELVLPSENIVQTSQYEFSLNYSQQEDEKLDSYTISLYSHQKTLLQTSGTIYTQDSSAAPSGQPQKAPSYTVTGLENAKQYYIRATGTTVNGMRLETPEILFTVAYIQAQIFSTLELNNKADTGAIEIRSNIISTGGTAEKDVIYLNNGNCADLRNNSVTFDIGYQAAGDFSKIIIFEQPNLNQTLLTFCNRPDNRDKQTRTDILYREGAYADSSEQQAYFELRANYGYTNYIRFSNFINLPNKDQMFALCITRIDHGYDLQARLVAKEA